MSTSLLYHAFGAYTFDYLKTVYAGGATYFHMVKKPKYVQCSVCECRDVTKEGVNQVPVRTLPIGNRPVFLVLHLHVLRCRGCWATRQETRDVAGPRKSYTKRFARFVVELSRCMTMSDIAGHLRVGWDLVKSIIEADLKRRLKRRSWRRVKRIAIDEIALRKGHNYMTVVVDLDSGQVLFVAEGRDHSCLQPFFKKLRRARAKLEAIAVDMSAAYAKAIRDFAPTGAVVVHDRFHVVAKMNEVIDAIRRDEQGRLEGEGKQVLKGSRYLLLRGAENLAKFPEKQLRLDALLQANELLHKAYLLKEDLRQFWSQGTRLDAVRFIWTWLAGAVNSGNRHLRRMASTVAKHIPAILAWYDHRITTGPLEGLNNKIKVLKRVAYGYRNADFFALRILFLHETQFKLVG